MDWLGDGDYRIQAYRNYQSHPKHEAHVSYALISGAVFYKAVKEYEKFYAQNGRSDNRAKAKEVMAGIVGTIVDKEFEKHGLGFLDKEKVKHQARRHCEDAVDDYGGY